MLQLQGNQIVLRDWIIEDLPIYKYWQTKDLEWKNWDGPYYPLTSLENLEKELKDRRRKILQQSFPQPRKRLVIAAKNTNQLLGTVSWYWQSQETNWLSNGIVLFDTQNRSKGMGFEALGLWNQYLFDHFPNIVRLDLRTWSGNIGMMRLAEKLGYTLEARFRQARIIKGEYFDSIGYGILRTEWNELYANGFEVKSLE
ncbi:MAG: GNAT family N-acetyltransferase [Chitinophagales bacterium]